MKHKQVTGTMYNEQIKLMQVNINKAKQLFNNGIEVYLLSSNMRPFNMWQSFCPIKKDVNSSETFDNIINSFSYYNCDNYRGKYINYFVKF